MTHAIKQSVSVEGTRMPVASTRLPTVVMIPGTLCDARIFSRQKRALRGLADVRLIGYRGLSLASDWAEGLLARLPERFSVVGFSLGGLLALELIRKAPQRVTGLAMVASNAGGASLAGRRKSARLWKIWRMQGPAAVVRQVKPRYFHHTSKRQQHAALLRDMAVQTQPKVALAQFRWAATRPDGLAALACFNGAVLLVSGANDHLCPPAMQRAMASAQPRAQWLELPRVGHFIPLEASSRLGDALRRWLCSASVAPTTNGTAML